MGPYGAQISDTRTIGEPLPVAGEPAAGAKSNDVTVRGIKLVGAIAADNVALSTNCGSTRVGASVVVLPDTANCTFPVPASF